jgi:hypothetical protein
MIAQCRDAVSVATGWSESGWHVRVPFDKLRVSGPNLQLPNNIRSG